MNTNSLYSLIESVCIKDRLAINWLPIIMHVDVLLYFAQIVTTIHLVKTYIGVLAMKSRPAY